MTDHTEERAAALAEATEYVDGPFKPGGFSVYQRDTYHFDIFAQRRPGYVKWYLEVENPKGMAWPLHDGARERAFRIRGEPGEIVVYDERWDPKRPNRERQSALFLSVALAMGWVMSELAEGEH